MNDTAERVFRELMQLPLEARERIVTRMYEVEEFEFDQEHSQELLRRIEDHESGRTKGIPWEEARKIIFAEDDDDAAS